MPRPRILYVIQSFPSRSGDPSPLVVGGAELQAQRVAHLLSPRFHIDVLSHRVPGQPVAEDAGEVHVSRLPLSCRGGKRGALAVLARLLLGGIRMPRADIVQGFQLNAYTLAGAALAGLMGSRYVIKITGRGNFERLKGVRGRLQLHLLHRAARALVVPSLSCARTARELGVPDGKIYHIPNGVDTTHFRPAGPEERAKRRAELGYTPQDFVFCWVGRLDRLKGLDCVPPAWELIARESPEARLLVVGDGAEEDVARRLVRAHPDSVRHLPFHADVRPFYACADAILLTSRSEGLSNVLLEGLASGLCAVVSGIPENAEVGQGQDFLLTFDRESPRSLADALAAIIGKRSRQVELGHLARQHVERHYSLRSTAARWEELYATLIWGTRPAPAAEGGEVSRPLLPAARPCEIVPAAPAPRAAQVVDLIPVNVSQRPRVARILPLQPIETTFTNATARSGGVRGHHAEVAAAPVERLPERVEKTTAVLQALAAYLRAADAEPAERLPGNTVSITSEAVPGRQGAAMSSLNLDRHAAGKTTELPRVPSSRLPHAGSLPPPPVRAASLFPAVVAEDEPGSATARPPRSTDKRLARVLAAVRSAR